MTTTSAQSRRDVYIENDSGGFSVVPSSAVDRIIADDRSNDHVIVAAHQAILLMLHGDDSFPARLIVGGSLDEDEEAEWIACATWKLDIPCGSVLLCGGFDPRALAGWRERNEHWLRCVHAFDVPPGEYRADVYTYRPTISGRFLQDTWPKPIGTWFREEHGGSPWPAWLVWELESFRELDPGHEDEWEDPSSISVDETRSNVIGYLVHLTPWDDDAELTALPRDGWFEPETGARVPPRCPLGIATDVQPYDWS